jgi:hypothetical protein
MTPADRAAELWKRQAALVEAARAYYQEVVRPLIAAAQDLKAITLHAGGGITLRLPVHIGWKVDTDPPPVPEVPEEPPEPQPRRKTP